MKRSIYNLYIWFYNKGVSIYNLYVDWYNRDATVEPPDLIIPADRYNAQVEQENNRIDAYNRGEEK